MRQDSCFQWLDLRGGPADGLVVMGSKSSRVLPSEDLDLCDRTTNCL